MAVLDDLGQKIKGKAQKGKGRIKQNTGNPLSGAVDELKGSFNDTVADMKLNARRNRATTDEDDF